MKKIWLILLLLAIIPIVSAASPYEWYNGTVDGNTSFTGDDEAVQTFTVGTEGTNENFIPNYTLLLLNVVNGNPTGDINVSIKAINATGLPTGVQLTSGVVDSQDLDGKPVQINFTIPTTLLASTEYALIVTLPDDVNPDLVGWARKGSDVYAGGQYIFNDGSSWEFKGWDTYFEIWGETGFPFTITTTLSMPGNNTALSTIGENFQANYTSSSNGNLTNATYHLWYSNGTVFNNSEIRTISGQSNSTTVYIDDFSLGDFYWNVYTCGINDTSVLCEWADDNWTFNVAGIINGIIYNENPYETDTENIQLNISTFQNITPTDSSLYYNGTQHSATVTVINDNYLLNSTFPVPATTGNKTFYFEWDINGSTETSPTYSHVVNGTSFALCNSSLANLFINFTFEDENNQSAISGIIPSSTFEYWLGDGTHYKTYTFVNNTPNLAYGFCASPDDLINLNYTIQYEATNYPQRTTENSTVVSDSVSEGVLSLLNSLDGLYVTFQVINAAEQVLSGVSVEGYRVISSIYTLIASGTTDAAGSVTFWLNPDFSHDFNFTLDGYNQYDTTITPTQSSYTITMTSSETGAINDYHQGISYSIIPTNETLLNDTAYNFEFNLTSSHWDVTEFGMVLLNSSGDRVDSDTEVTNGGSSEIFAYNVGNDTYLELNYYWVINGNYTNGTRTWYIVSSTGEDWSILRFFEDFRLYSDSGLFGITAFARGIIIFLIMFVFVGIMSYKFGLTSPAAISSLVFGIVLFFDVGLGLIPNPINAIPNFPTFFVGLIMVSFIIKEVSR